MGAWNDWYHCMSNTYGTWLPGDPRGFRTRGHREHIEGDYKSPPPQGRYEQRHRAAKQLLKRESVVLPRDVRPIVLAEMRSSFKRNGVEVIALSMSGMHVHVLGRFPMKRRTPTFDERGLRTSAIDDPVRHLMGLAKQWSAKRLIRDRHCESGPIWARRGKIVRISDRRHQVKAFKYILDHVNEGATVWSVLDEKNE